MFKQVYFHKTRIAFDLHLHHVMSQLLPNGGSPPPHGDGPEEFLKWDDWRVLGLLAKGEGGPHAKRMLGRDHTGKFADKRIERTHWKKSLEKNRRRSCPLEFSMQLGN